LRFFLSRLLSEVGNEKSYLVPCISL
jgi:hypothetical protein